MKRSSKILLLIVVLVIGIRILLPSLIKKQVNKNLASLPEYTGSVEDVDLVLYKGGVAVDGFKIQKKNLVDSISFININRVELKIDLKALFKGHIFLNCNIKKPQVNFVADNDTSKQQFGGDYLWFESLLELQPIEVNTLTIENGAIHFKRNDVEPLIDLKMKDIFIEANNLRNVINNQLQLPSHLVMSAKIYEKGSLSIVGDMDIVKEIPDLNIDAKVQNVEIKELNNFLLVYTNLDASKGLLNVYSEFALTDQKIDGYIKPIIKELKFKEKNKNDSFKKDAIEFFADLSVALVKNHKENQIATKVPISGKIDDSNINTLQTILSTLSNSFIKAIQANFDNTIEYPVLDS